MEEVSGAVGGFRAAIQDLLVPELKALQVEVRNVKETLDRHEKWLERHDQTLSQLADAIRQLSKEQAERFAAMQQEMDKRFMALQQEMSTRFIAVDERLSVMTAAIHNLQKEMSMLMLRLDYGEKIHQLELQMARLAKAASLTTI